MKNFDIYRNKYEQYHHTTTFCWNMYMWSNILEWQIVKESFWRLPGICQGHVPIYQTHSYIFHFCVFPSWYQLSNLADFYLTYCFFFTHRDVSCVPTKMEPWRGQTTEVETHSAHTHTHTVHTCICGEPLVYFVINCVSPASLRGVSVLGELCCCLLCVLPLFTDFASPCFTRLCLCVCVCLWGGGPGWV